MEYHVPQFIEVEDKLIGQLTLKQFIYLAGAGGICIVLFSYLPFILAALIALPIVGLGGALAFYKVNGKPLVAILEAAFTYYTSARLMLWKYTAPEKKGSPTPSATPMPPAAPARPEPRLTRGKLAELAWSLDVPATAKEVQRRL